MTGNRISGDQWLCFSFSHHRNHTVFKTKSHSESEKEALTKMINQFTKTAVTFHICNWMATRGESRNQRNPCPEGTYDSHHCSWFLEVSAYGYLIFMILCFSPQTRRIASFRRILTSQAKVSNVCDITDLL